MRKQLRRGAASVLGAALLIGGAYGTNPADARDAQLRETHEVVQIAAFQPTVKRFAIAAPTPPPPPPAGPAKFAAPTDTAEGQYCDDTPVADDITDCDIGEIAWDCPDDPGESYENCTGYPNGSFPD